MDTKQASWSDPQASDFVGAGLTGLGVGLGARGIRHLIDLTKKRDLPPEVPAIPSHRSPVPVEVSPDEAKELEASGVHVKHAATLLDNVARGALFVPAAYAGWSMLDNHLNNQRKAIAQKRLDAARGRLQGLMSDEPLPQDQALHQTMKAAEAHYFGQSKTAFFGELANEAGSGLVNLASPLGLLLGGSGAILGMSAYNRVKNDNKYQKTVGALKGYLEHQQTTPSEAEIEPVIHEHKQQAESQPQFAVHDQLKAAALEQPETNAPKLKKLKTPVLATNKDRLVNKLDQIPLATKSDSTK